MVGLFYLVLSIIIIHAEKRDKHEQRIIKSHVQIVWWNSPCMPVNWQPDWQLISDAIKKANIYKTLKVFHNNVEHALDKAL